MSAAAIECVFAAFHLFAFVAKTNGVVLGQIRYGVLLKPPCGGTTFLMPLLVFKKKWRRKYVVTFRLLNVGRLHFGES